LFTGTSAATMGVSATLQNNASLLQISSSATQNSNTEIATQISQLATAAQSALNGRTFSGSYSATVAGLGDALSEANAEAANQTTVMTMMQTQRSSVSGVNVDEEMTNMILFQRAYQASAQVVNTINTLLGDTLAMKN
jgi:flagellar hook-associated protein 1 FlgK